MGKIIANLEIMRNTAALYGHLMGSTAIAPPTDVLLDDHAEERISTGRAYLGRDPFFLRNPFTGKVIWVESEPDDWRELFEQIEADVLAKLARRRRMH